jgi:hypothetical protein
MTFVVDVNGLKASYPTDSSCKLDTMIIPGKEGVYEALQFHIHTSSEHTIDGSFFGAELHVVHKLKSDTETRFAVAGMVIEPTSNVNNPIFEDFIAKIEETNAATLAQCGENAATVVPTTDSVRRRLESFDVYSLIDPAAGYYFYDGGLTTPPCSEVVWWNLADTPVTISVNQYTRLVNRVLRAVDGDCMLKTVADPNTGSTSRPTVPLGDRTLQRVCPAAAEVSVASDASVFASMSAGNVLPLLITVVGLVAL